MIIDHLEKCCALHRFASRPYWNLYDGLQHRIYRDYILFSLNIDKNNSWIFLSHFVLYFTGFSRITFGLEKANKGGRGYFCLLNIRYDFKWNTVYIISPYAIFILL